MLRLENDFKHDARTPDLTEFLQVLHQIGGYVRNLTLSTPGLTRQTLDISIIEDILSSCPNIHALSLDGFLDRELTGGVSMPPRFRLKSLSFENDNRGAHYVGGFARILQLFHTIDLLDIGVPNDTQVIGQLPYPPLPQPVLQKLAPLIDFVQIKAVVCWDIYSSSEDRGPFQQVLQVLQRSIAMGALTSLEVKKWLLWNPEVLRPMISAANLTHFALAACVHCTLCNLSSSPTYIQKAFHRPFRDSGKP